MCKNMKEYAEILIYKIFTYKKIQQVYRYKKIGLKLSLKRIQCGNSSFKFHGKFVEKFRRSYLKGLVAVTFCIRSTDSEKVFGT